MLFNSFVFLFAFLPIALTGYFAIARIGHRKATAWLLLASLVFYGWLNPAWVPLLLVSIAGNYGIACLLDATRQRQAVRRWGLRFGVTANLLALIYYKYFVWLISLADSAGLLQITVPGIVLPLGISFFTFTQIGYLIDVYNDVTEDRDLLNYAVFVTFFPHLIAGPILHNRDIMPQFAAPRTYRYSARNMNVGLSIFIIGLLKKTLIADPTSAGVAEVFSNPSAVPLFTAWHAALSYSLQLYFDFSGYSDMAIGLARMFNVRFPLNFNSPYKAQSVIDYWQRWHMSLTHYLTQYVYNPLTVWIMWRRVARRLPINQVAQRTLRGFTTMIAFPVFVTIVLIGVWHGSGAQFVVFGLLHAAYLTVNRIWRLFYAPNELPRGLGILWRVALTYMCVFVGAVFFRAPSVAGAFSMLAGMAGLHGFGPALAVSDGMIGFFGNVGVWSRQHGLIYVADRQTLVDTRGQIAWLLLLYGIVWGLPNTQQTFIRFRPALDTVEPGNPAWLRWQLTIVWAVVFGCLGTLELMFLSGTGEFLYFQF